jgi:hypothetical protein
MSVHVSQPLAVDLLAQAIELARPHLDRSVAIVPRVRLFWAAVVAARDLGTSDVVQEEFTQLARDTGLTADLGRHGEEDVEHVVRWGLLNRNPFGRLKHG